jgi:hypothetical protein
MVRRPAASLFKTWVNSLSNVVPLRLGWFEIGPVDDDAFFLGVQ